MMAFEIRCKDPSVTDELREYAERRLHFALDRFPNVRRVAMRLDDLNGPKGGKDKFCRIVAKLGFASVVVEEVQMDWCVAISRGTHRLAQTIARELGRANQSTSRIAERTGQDDVEETG